MSAPTKLRRLIALVVACLLVAVTLYAFLIEPRWLRVNHQCAEIAHLDKPLRIVLVADLHRDNPSLFGSRVAEVANAQQGDLILVAGDLVPPAASTAGAEAFLNQLRAPLGVFLVPGNHEHWALPGPPQDFIRSENATLRVNEARSVRDDLWIIGLDDALAG